ncbi:MAG: hypothetical protein ACFB02_12800 [Mastigocoleus sp.]
MERPNNRDFAIAERARETAYTSLCDRCLRNDKCLTEHHITCKINKGFLAI